MPRPFGLRIGLPCLALLTAAVTLGAERAPRTFAQVVQVHFARWDLNGDGKLSPLEVLRGVSDSSNTGEEAAALATIHQRQQRKDRPLVAFGQEELLGHTAATNGAIALGSLYRRNLDHITRAKRVCFADGAPSLDGFHQGREGDCYLLAVVGAAVVRDATTVRRMFRPGPGGACQLLFPDGERVEVPRVTDAEIALGAFAATQGLWMNYLEKGFGILQARRGAARPGEDPIDVIGHGGSCQRTLRLLTGHHAERTPLRKSATLPGHEHQIATILAAARRDRRLVCCNTTRDEPLSPGLVPGHVYAVLAYHPDTRSVEIWNPWGNSFTPKGAAGPAHGYPTKGGCFTLPLREFTHIFSTLFWETTQVAQTKQ